MKKVRYNVRKFINKPGYHSVAFVYAKIGGTGSVEFRIGDCDRTISLSFDTYGKAGKLNAIYKAETLASIMTEFAAKLKEYYAADQQHEDDDY